jgi:enamine deaminase RidA (YjgF/YER057c/UK114 family)
MSAPTKPPGDPDIELPPLPPGDRGRTSAAITPELREERATVVKPPGLAHPRGFSHGWLAPPGSRVLFVAGQTAGDADGRVGTRDFTAQFGLALGKAIAVVRAAGGRAEDILRMTVYVTDMELYRKSRKPLRAEWRRLMGRHYPAMSLVEVGRLVEPDAVVEIEVTAAVPESAGEGTA